VPVEMKKKNVRQDLLESAFRSFSERGYLGATTREIAYQAKVTELTLFRHFRSKERLFEEVLKNFTFLPRLKELLPKLHGLSHEDALYLVGKAFLETLKERKALVRILLSEVNHYPEKVRDIYNHFIDEVVRNLAIYLKDKQKKGQVKKVNPETASRAFLGMLFSFFLTESIIGGREIEGRQLNRKIKEFVDIFINGVVLE